MTHISPCSMDTCWWGQQTLFSDQSENLSFLLQCISTIQSSRTQLKWIIFIFKIRKKKDCCFWLTFSLEVQTNRLNIVQSHQVTLKFLWQHCHFGQSVVHTNRACWYICVSYCISGDRRIAITVCYECPYKESVCPTISLVADGNCRFISFQFNKKYVHVYRITCNT